jgi:diaminopimelate epimerase
MLVQFSKFQGTGNDFVMIDNRDGCFTDLSIEQIRLLCDRKFGIGADGLIKLNSKVGFDFEMDYYNADGSKSFCGNGARCTTAFAAQLGILSSIYKFDAIDGVHFASIKNEGIVSLKMSDVEKVDSLIVDYYAHTGSPHYVRFVEDVNQLDVFSEGQKVRYSEGYKIEGVNVNFVQEFDDSCFVRTYERGVEDETLSCGTGVTACALVLAYKNKLEGEFSVQIKTLGGELLVKAIKLEDSFTEVYLEGPAKCVFHGEMYV